MSQDVALYAPDFSLPDQFGATRSLNEASGWRLVWWLPSTLMEHASGCGDRIAAGFSEHLERDGRLRVFGMTFDGPKLTKEFARRAFITFPVLTATREVAKEYGVYRGSDDEWECFPKKRAFLVDPEGRIVKVYTSIDPDLFVHEVLDDLPQTEPTSTGILGKLRSALKV